MKSRITIEVDFDSGMPYIRVITDTKSDDVRDKLINHFRQKLSYNSSWCSVRFDDTAVSGDKLFEIHPIIPSEIEGQMNMMRSAISSATPIQQGTHKIIIGDITPCEITDKEFAYYQFHSSKSLAGLREGILKEAIEAVINNPDNYTE